MDRIDFAFAITGIFIVTLATVAYYDNVNDNSNKSEVFSKITNTTTNAEIVGYIQEVCSNTLWYRFKVDCETSLLKTFITPTK